MADLMESRCGSLPTAQLAPHAEQFLSLLERKGIVPDQEITNEKARSADKALRKNHVPQHPADAAALPGPSHGHWNVSPPGLRRSWIGRCTIWMPYSLLSMHSWPCRIIGWSIGWNV